MGLLPITQTIAAAIFFSCSICYVLGSTEKIILTSRNEESLITVIFIERFKDARQKGLIYNYDNISCSSCAI